MAYIGAVDYDDGGRIRSLDGLAAVTYDNGRIRNLLGAELGAVKYDDGGRFRTLVGLGQDLPPDMPPPDVGIDQSIAVPAFPISYTPPSPAPFMFPFIPSPIVDLTSAPITGTLTPPPPPPASAGTLVSVLPPVASALTSILNSVKNVFSGSPTAVKPIVAGTVAPAGTVGASWFSQQGMVTGLPNWGVLAGVGIAGVVLVAVMRSSGSGSGSGSPRRRRNPAELILMGANPTFSHLPHWQKRKKRETAIRRQLRAEGVKIPRGQWPSMSQLSMYELRRLRRTS